MSIRRKVPMSRLVAGAVVAVLVTLHLTSPASAHDGYLLAYPGPCVVFLHSSVSPNIGALDSNYYANGSDTCTYPPDNIWAGRVQDNHAGAPNDGSCVSAYFQGIHMGTSCNSGGVGFSFYDPNGNSDAFTCIVDATHSKCSVNRNF